MAANYIQYHQYHRLVYDKQIKSSRCILNMSIINVFEGHKLYELLFHLRSYHKEEI